jgi:hypothetical protein
MAQAVSASVNATRAADCHRERIGVRARLSRYDLADRRGTDPAELRPGAWIGGANHLDTDRHPGISGAGAGVADCSDPDCGEPDCSDPGCGAPGCGAPDFSAIHRSAAATPTGSISTERRRAGRQSATGCDQRTRIEHATIPRSTDGRATDWGATDWGATDWRATDWRRARGGEHPGCRSAAPGAGLAAAGCRAAGRNADCPGCGRCAGSAR